MPTSRVRGLTSWKGGEKKRRKRRKDRKRRRRKREEEKKKKRKKKTDLKAMNAKDDEKQGSNTIVDHVACAGATRSPARSHKTKKEGDIAVWV